MYLYIKALHIIFVVTWFAGMFYMPRLFIYNAEAAAKPEPVRDALREQFGVMQKRLWYGITWPSAVLTADTGIYYLVFIGGHSYLAGDQAGFCCGLVCLSFLNPHNF